jgi:DNA-binding Xre family transcriptional regulator
MLTLPHLQVINYERSTMAYIDIEKRRERSRRYYHRHKDRVRKSQRKYEQTEAAKKRRDKYNTSEKGRERTKKYRASRKGKAVNKKKNAKQNRRRRKERLMLIADVPAFVVTPYGRQLYSQITGLPPLPPPGINTYKNSKKVAESIGVSYNQFSNILCEKNIRVNFDTIDAICMRLDSHVDEVYDDMKKYADEHPEINWPEDYKPNKFKGRNKI